MPFLPTTQNNLQAATAAARGATFHHICAVVGWRSETEGGHVGSGFFVTIEDAACVVTASHVVRKAQTDYGHAAIRSPKGVQIVDAWHHDLANDLAIAVVPMPDPSMVPIRPERIATSTGDVPDHHMFVHGFPERGAYFSPLLGGLVVNALAFVTYDQPSTSAFHLPALNFCLEWLAPATPAIDDQGKPYALPFPHGLSGSAVWALGSDVSVPFVPMLYGVSTDWDEPSRAILVTRAEHLGTFLVEVAHQIRAHRAWILRGLPIGDPEVDWFATA